MKFHKGQSRKHNILTFVLILFISNCRPTPDAIQQLPVTNTPYPTPTAVANSPTSLPTLVPATTIKIEDRCLSVEESLPPDFQLEGVWVRQETNPYLEIIRENTKYRVPFDGGERLYNSEGNWSVSPNGEWLAYIDTVYDTTGRSWRKKGDLLKVIHVSGYFLTMDYWPMTYQSIEGWVDDKNLLLELGQRSIVLNPFSGNWHELKDPDWLSNLTVDKPWWYDIKRYSPHLDTVIVRLDDHSELKNPISEEKLFGDANFGFFEKSSWSSDGTMLAIATNDGDVLNIFQNNTKISEVELSNSKNASSFGGFISRWDNLVWSQNNKKLLIDTYSNLYVLDVEDSAIHNLCFVDPDIHKGSNNSFFYLPIGNYIVAPMYKSNENYNYEYFDVLIDVEGMHAYKLPTSKYNGRIGWLALPEPTEK